MVLGAAFAALGSSAFGATGAPSHAHSASVAVVSVLPSGAPISAIAAAPGGLSAPAQASTSAPGGCTASVPYSPYYGLAFVAFLYLLYVLVTRRANPLWIVVGADGRLSSSKLQFFAWTCVVIYAYMALAIDRLGHVTCTVGTLPANVLIAMGLSLTTATAAKGIAVNYTNAGKGASNPIRPTIDLRYLIMDDAGITPDLPKIQMLSWTVVAIVVFTLDLSVNFSAYATCNALGPMKCFPDIDTALMILMGLGQGAYLGFKLVPPSTTNAGVVVAGQDNKRNAGPSEAPPVRTEESP